MKQRFYVTTPIYYVNDIPHIGHAYTTIAADILARFNRLQGKEVFFLTGTDEHGQKVEKAAAEKKRTPKEHADIMVDNFRNLWKRLNISNDAFIRTTDDAHIKTVQGLLQMLWDRGEIEKGNTPAGTALLMSVSGLKRIWWKATALTAAGLLTRFMKRTIFSLCQSIRMI